MIHQFIFAGPKPGRSAKAFQSYWLNFHAVDYAARIPQIRRYLVAPRLRWPSAPREVTFFEGAAEIWLANDQEQLASLESPEFLQGARADEPRWAAYWQTLALDTEAVVVQEAAGPLVAHTKLYVFLKRRPELSLPEFRERLLAEHAPRVQAALPALSRYLIGFARPGLYGLGEPRFDALEVWSFADLPALQAACPADTLAQLEASWLTLADGRYLFTFTGQENWVIRPGER